MHNNRTTHAGRIFAALGALAILALAGCTSTTVTNMTPTALSTSPTQTYTITARVTPSASNLIPGSETVQIMIGGQAYNMTKVPNLDTIYAFDYKAPPGVTQIAYYFLVQYNVSNSGIVSARTDYSTLQHAAISDKNGFINTAAAPVNVNAGNTTTVVKGTPVPYTTTTAPAATRATSPVTTTYFAAPGTTYTAPVATTAYAGNAVPAGALNAGSFGSGAGAAAVAMSANAAANNPGVNAAQSPASPFAGNNISINEPTNDITVSPQEISINPDEYIVLKFVTPAIVTGQPLLIDVTTDIPASVIMPEVYVKVGSNVGSVNLKGGAPGKGHLYARAAGYAKTLTIPITVR